MLLLAALVLCGILLLVVGTALYFANHQQPNRHPYGSWSNVFSQQFNGKAMDIRENLEKEIAAGQRQASVGRRASGRKRSKKR